jgi:glycosyltransferase involved in cell wall biosynthesis
MGKSISFTVIIPYFNDKGTIVNCLQSVRNQTYAPSAVIIIDDGSGNPELDSIAKEFDFTLLRLNKNHGSGVARTSGARLAKTSHIALLDADDYWYPTHLQTHAAIWENCDERVGMISTKMTIVFDYEKVHSFYQSSFNRIESVFFPSKFTFAFSNPLWNSATTIDREILQKVKYWTSKPQSYAEDYELIIRMLIENVKIGYSPTITGNYLRHTNSKSDSVAKVADSRTKSSLNLMASIEGSVLQNYLVKFFILNYIWISSLLYISKQNGAYVAMQNVNLQKLVAYRILNPIFHIPPLWRMASSILRILKKISVRSFLLNRQNRH